MVNLKAGQQDLFESDLLQEKDIKIVSQSLVMKTLLKEIKSISKISSPVLVLGESGSGRSMIAKEIYHSSVINNKNLVVVNVSGVNPDIISFQLFGSEEDQSKDCFSNLEDKTLLIQNIDALPLDIQSKLLTVLKNKNKTKNRNHYKFRVICTANSLISQDIEKGNFREDLFRYLAQTLLIMPSLAEREEDIPGLVKVFLEVNNFRGIIDELAMNKLKFHSWKGNVIELGNICFQISSLYKDQLITEDLLPIFSEKDLDLALFVKYNPKINLDDLINYYISQSLKYFKSKKKSAESLNISVKTIYNKIEQGVIKSNL